MSILPMPPIDQPPIPPAASPPAPPMPPMAPAPAMMSPAAMPQAVMPPEIVVPQMEAPQRFDFKIPLEQGDIDTVGSKYGMEIERALQARRSGAAQNFQIIGNVPDAATTATVTANTRRPGVKSWEDEIQDLWNRYEMVPPDRDLPFDGAANYRCIARGTKILTADLRWVLVETLRANDGVLGVDEYGEGKQKSPRKLRESHVTATGQFMAPGFRVVTDRGSVVVNERHPFLVNRKYGASVGGWVQTGTLKPGQEIKFVAPPWESESGDTWLAGITDGEGSVSNNGKTQSRISIAQNPGKSFDRLEQELARRGFDFRSAPANSNDTWAAQIRGGIAESLRFLGQVRPGRLLRDWQGLLDGGVGLPQDSWAKVLRIEPVGATTFVSLETSLRTYIADGFVSHNTPLTKWMVDAVLARLMAGLATVRPIWRVEAREPAFTDGAGKVEEFLDYVAEEEVDFVDWLDIALIQAGVEGAGIAYVTWVTASEHQLIEQVSHVEEPITDDFGAQIGVKKTSRSAIVEQDNIIESRPNIDLIPMMDFLVADSRRKKLKDQPWMGHRARLYRAEIAALKGHEGYFDDQIAKALAGGGQQPGSSSTQKADEGVDARVGIKTVNDFSQMKMLDPFDVWSLTAWYDWDLDGKPERVVLEIVMPQRILIRMIKFPYLHGRPFYVPLVLLPRPHSWYPRSLVGDLRMTQDETDAMHNHRTDATSIAISSLFMFLYDEQAGYDPSRQRISLGESIKVDGDINHIQVLAKSFRGITVPGMDIEQLLIDFGKFLTGIHEMQTGGTAERRTTAFEIGAVIQEGNVKFRRMIERASEAMAEIAYQIIALYQQHANRALPKVYKVLNSVESPFREIMAGEMFGRWKYRVHGVALAHQRDMDVKKAMDVTNLVSTNPIFAELVMNNPRRKYHVAKTLLDKIGAPVEDIIGTEQEAITTVPPMPASSTSPDVEKKVHDLQAKAAAGGGEGGRPGGSVPQPGSDAGAKAVGVV